MFFFNFCNFTLGILLPGLFPIFLETYFHCFGTSVVLFSLSLVFFFYFLLPGLFPIIVETFVSFFTFFCHFFTIFFGILLTGLFPIIMETTFHCFGTFIVLFRTLFFDSQFWASPHHSGTDFGHFWSFLGDFGVIFELKKVCARF